MVKTSVKTLVVTCAFFLPSALGAAETGDLNDDGKVDLLDVVHFDDLGPKWNIAEPQKFVDDLVAAAPPGSLDGFVEFACSGWNDPWRIPGAIFLE